MPKYVVRGQRVRPQERERARELRSVLTPAERVLWSVLRRGQVRGLHFRRQQVIGGYIADFYCHSLGLVIEVDGDVHALQVDHDRERDGFLATFGGNVLRFTNDEVLNDLQSVVRRIETMIDELSISAQCTVERTQPT